MSSKILQWMQVAMQDYIYKETSWKLLQKELLHAIAVSNASAKMDQRQLSCMEQNNVTLAVVQEESRWLHTLYIADIRTCIFCDLCTWVYILF